MTTTLKAELEYADLAHTPQDGRRYELLDGQLYVTLAPNPYHQRASKRLQRQLEDYFEGRDLGEVFNAPIDVILSKRDVLQPDLVVVADPAQVSRRGIEGPPLLAIEVLSPSTEDGDRELKPARLARHRVPHYWVVDPVAKTVECFRLTGARYKLVGRFGAADAFAHPEWTEMKVDLRALWRVKRAARR